MGSYGFTLSQKRTRVIHKLFFENDYKDFCAELPFLTNHLKTFCNKYKENPVKNYAQLYNKTVEFFKIISIIHGAYEQGFLNKPLDWLGGRTIADLNYSEVLHLKQNKIYGKKEAELFRETNRIKRINPQYKAICYEKNYLYNDKITFFNGDYIESFNQIKSILKAQNIPFENVILYCDPPYINTCVKQYNLKQHSKRGKVTANHFDYEKFCAFLEKAAADGFNVYYSEYTKLKENHNNILTLNKKNILTSNKKNIRNLSKTEFLIKVGGGANNKEFHLI